MKENYFLFSALRKKLLGKEIGLRRDQKGNYRNVGAPVEKEDCPTGFRLVNINRNDVRYLYIYMFENNMFLNKTTFFTVKVTYINFSLAMV